VSVLSEESKRRFCRIIPDRRCELIVFRGKELFYFIELGCFCQKVLASCPEFEGLSLSLDFRIVQLPPFSEMPVPSEFLFKALTLLDKIDLQ